MNNCVLVGRTTKEIELRRTNSGKSVATFTVAVNRRGKNDGADFIQCVAWNRTAEVLNQYVHKGDRVGITGSISTRKFEDNHGNRRYITEVIVQSFEFMQDKRNNSYEPINGGVDMDEDLPF